MAKERRTLRGGRLAAAAYDPREQQLEIDFVDGERRIFKAVPAEVWRRFVAAPNPAVFYADRIEEEYAVERGRAERSGDARSKLDSLFGGGGRAADDAPGGDSGGTGGEGGAGSTGGDSGTGGPGGDSSTGGDGD